MTPDPEIVAVLEKLKLQYEDALETRRRADARATQLKAAITALEAASAEEPLVFTGTLADACRVVLRGTTQPMSPLEVRDAVKGIGFPLSTIKHDNPMASIHSVLKRLVESGDAEKTKDGMRYRWTGRAKAERTYAGRLSELLEAPGNLQTISTALANLTGTESLARFQEELLKTTKWADTSGLAKSLEGLTHSPLAEAVEKLAGIKPKK